MPMPISLAKSCSSIFHNRTREPLEPPPSSVMMSRVARGQRGRPTSFHGLGVLVRESLGADPFSGTVFAFRSKRMDRPKFLFFDGTGVVPVSKMLDAGAFCWPKPGDAALRLTAAETAALLDGLDWRRVHMPRETVVSAMAG